MLGTLVVYTSDCACKFAIRSDAEASVGATLNLFSSMSSSLSAILSRRSLPMAALRHNKILVAWIMELLANLELCYRQYAATRVKAWHLRFLLVAVLWEAVHWCAPLLEQDMLRLPRLATRVPWFSCGNEAQNVTRTEIISHGQQIGYRETVPYLQASW